MSQFKSGDKVRLASWVEERDLTRLCIAVKSARDIIALRDDDGVGVCSGSNVAQFGPHTYTFEAAMLEWGGLYEADLEYYAAVTEVEP